jgi:hypothetical protein
MRGSASLGDCRKITYQIAQGSHSSSRRGDGRIVELCNGRHNAEDGRKDQQAGMLSDRNRLRRGFRAPDSFDGGGYLVPRCHPPTGPTSSISGWQRAVVNQRTPKAARLVSQRPSSASVRQLAIYPESGLIL